jgi:hypothetical protein
MGPGARLRAVIPSVGRVVHYVSYGTPGGEYGMACRAATVTEVPEGVASPQTIGLCVLNPTGLFFDRTVSLDDGLLLKTGESRSGLCGEKDYAGGTWHWPARI